MTSFSGIDSGIENTNYFVDTDQNRRFVLTLFERLDAGQLPYYLELMHHLAANGIPCPDPIPRNDGQWLSVLNAKPASLVTRLPGASIDQPGTAHCEALGSVLARMHLASASFATEQPNLRGLNWWRDTVPQVAPHLSTPVTRHAGR